MITQRLRTEDFVDALYFVERETGRSVTESLNRAALHIIIGSGSYPGAMQLTPKANKGVIQAISSRRLAGFVIARNRKAGKGPLTSAQIRVAVRRERSRRLASVGYTAWVGWNKAARAFGGRGIRGIQRGFPKSDAFHGWGQKATLGSKIATLVNTAPAAERIGFVALQSAVDNAAQDLVDYGTKKMQATMRKVQP